MHTHNQKAEQSHHGIYTLFKHQYALTILHCVEICFDFMSICISIVVSYSLYIFFFKHSLPGGFPYYFRLSISAGFIGVVTFYFNGLYRHQASMMNLLETRKLIKVLLFLFLCLMLYSFLSKEQYSRITLCLALCLSLPLLLICRFVFFKFNQYLSLHDINIRRIFIFGAGETGRLLFQSICHTPKLGARAIGFFDPDIKNNRNLDELYHPPGAGKPILFITDIDQCLTILQQQNIHEIFLTISLFREDDIHWQLLLSFCTKHNITLHTVPYLQCLYAQQVCLSELNGIPFVSFNDISIGRVEQLSKRCFDLLVSSILMISITPLMLVIAVLIKIDSKGPILFKQNRVGKDSTLFTIYKFRTMYIDTPVFHISPKMAGDSRITRIGKILRKLSLDELPQILNVLQGTMSLVGPRPEMPFIVKNEYNELHRQRLRIKPGVTGIWQISADRTRQIHEDISYDLFYLSNRSLLLDVLILLRTIPALFLMRTY